MNIFTLTGTILVDNAKANESISSTGKESEGLMTKVGNGIKTVAGIGAAVGGAVAAGSVALYGMATKAAETTDRIDKLSAKIGISKTAFQEWDYIMGQNGMDAEKLQVGVKTLVSQMDAAAGGSNSAKEAFDKLGVTWDDGNGKLKSQETMMSESINALAGMADGSERAKLATELFGKAGAEMAPMLNSGTEGIEDLKNRAHELGLVMSDDSVNAGVVLGDTIDDVKDSFGAIVTKIGVEVMPIVQELLEWVLANMPQIQAIVSGVFEVISGVVSVAGEWIGKFIGFIQNLVTESQTEGSNINGIWNEVKDTFAAVFDGIIEIVKVFIDMFKSFWNEWGDTITVYAKGVWDQLKIIFQTFFNVVIDIFNIFKDLFSGNWSALWEDIKKLVSDVWEGIKKLVENSFATIVGVLSSVGEKIKTAWNNVWNGVKKSLSDAWTNITTSVSTNITNVVTKVKELATRAMDALKSLPKDALQIGKDFVQGLVNGIANMISSVVDKAKSMANSVTTAVKSTLKIHSPSKVMTEAGEMVGEGLAVGIEGTTGKVNKAVDDMTSFKDNDLTASSAVGSATSSSGQTFNFYNTTVRSSKDIDTIQRQIYKAVVQANRTVGTV